ncbi:YrbL family protein [Tatumella ptyseos]|uniref:YrbL family protein n=1 Tax=Tatumella ptyseos TaxID=82987 RepID=UPI0026F3386C|nr:YrbL family protein [Tatumella ptyseos]WKX27435.1 YrbL family protein [Tatumella ptyseos]
MKLTEPPLVLSDSLLIAKGRHRACYQHPKHPELCVKVHLNPHDDLETLREVRYFKWLHRRNVKLNSIADYCGKHATTFGMGYVYELVRDYDGQVSKTLDHYLRNFEMTEPRIHALSSAYQEFKQSFHRHYITMMNLKAYNIVFKRESETCGHFYLIDNLGSANLLPLSYFFKSIATRMLQRKFMRFESLVRERYHFSINS